MKNYDYWKSFVKTGKIDDYLNYIACTHEDASTRGHASSIKECMEEDYHLRSKEGGFHAGISNNCDGDGTISHAGW
ncbi:MAG: hypothetical protein GX237_03555 [Clostridiales bacterium]|nr:hypothetical protein [Clostridiales bacterium]